MASTTGIAAGIAIGVMAVIGAYVYGEIGDTASLNTGIWTIPTTLYAVVAIMALIGAAFYFGR